MADFGFWYPTAPGEQNHIALAVYVVPENTTDLAEVPFNTKAFVRALADEMATLPANVHAVIFSNEHCHSRLTSAEHISKLHTLLKKYFETVTVVAYLRRQDVMACSSYSTYLLFGGTSTEYCTEYFQCRSGFWPKR